jgi:ligand-binding sensor domain-containing protein
MRHIIFALALCLLPAALFAQAYQWTTFTSTSNAVDLIEANGQVWTATTGGISGYSTATGTFDNYTNTRGLAMNQCAAVGKDDRGFIWAGLGDARITRLNPETGVVRQIVDLQGEVFAITDILNVGDEVFVSGNNGIYRFAYRDVVDNYRVIESIRVIGTFPGETRVNGLAVYNDTLYAATNIGLARAALNQPQLSAPSAWETFTAGNSILPQNAINAIGTGPFGLWIATPDYILCFRNGQFGCASIHSGVVAFDSSYAITHTNLLRNDGTGQGVSWSTVGPAFGNLTGICHLSSGGYALAAADNDNGRGGISIFNGDAESPEFTAVLSSPGIGGNTITALGLDAVGTLWVGGSGSTAGVYVKRGDDWTNYSRSSGDTARFFRYTPTGFAFDNEGGAWVGSMGAGVAWFHQDTFTLVNTWDSTSFYDSAGTGHLIPRLFGISGAPQYVETYVTRSADGDIYISNLEAVTDLSLIRAPHEWIARGNNRDPWTYYRPGLHDQFSDFPAIGQLLVDPMDRIWAGGGRNGNRTFVLDERGTPADTADDVWSYFTPTDRKDPVTCYEDINKEVLTWDIDSQGYLWVGTVNGAYYSQGGVPSDPSQVRFICVADLPIGRRVNAIHVDAQDNKWFGTDEGIAVMDKNFNYVNVFQTASSIEHASGLISNNISAITSNPRTGEIWVGTPDGLSRFTSAYVASGSDLDKIWPYPNPFRADGTQRMRIDPARLGGHFDDMRIFTISGRLVRTLNWSEMTNPGRGGGWDGRNNDGELVAGGVYIIVVASSDGMSATGKVAVLGR